MVSTPDLEGDSGHAAEARHHDLPAGDFPFYQAAQGQIRSKSDSADKEPDTKEVAREYDRKRSRAEYNKKVEKQ